MRTSGITIFTALFVLTGHLSFSQCAYTGGELVTNGSFENCTPAPCSGVTVTSNQTDYSPDYAPANCPSGIYGGAYAITSDAGVCYSGWVPASNSAHTGSYGMIVDGNGNSRLWCQTVPVVAGTTYEFSAWYQNAVKSGVAPGEIPELQLTIDGAPITSSTAVVDYLGGWEQNKCLWKAPAAATTADICIQLVATSSPSGNDVLLDDISFKAVTGASCTSGSCSYTGVVPVNMVSFTVKKTGSKVQISWTTATEENASYFSIEKSNDAINFYEVAQADAKGWSAVLSEYEYYDLHFDNTSYYRIKTVDHDGSFKFSNIEVVQKEDDYAWLVRNENGQLEIRAVVKDETQWNIAVYTLLGQAYINEKVYLKKGTNFLTNGISCEENKPKVIRISDSDGKVILSEVFVYK
jgi:hypothetical protein